MNSKFNPFSLKLDFTIRCLEYHLVNECKQTQPCLLVSFDESVDRLTLADPLTLAVDAMDMKGTRVHTITSRCLSMEDFFAGTLLLYLVHPHLDPKDHTEIFQRIHQTVVCKLSDVSVGKRILTLCNKLNQVVAKYEFTIVRARSMKEDTEVSWPRIRGVETLPDDTLRDQMDYDSSMASYMQRHFPYTFKGTQTMTLFNDYFAFGGKSLFYGFFHQKPQPTNPEYWDHLVRIAVESKYGQSHFGASPTAKPCKDHNEYYATFDDEERNVTMMKMYSLPSMGCYYQPDFVVSVQQSLDQRNGNKRKCSGKLKFTEDFCPMHGTWSGDCEEFGTYTASYMHQQLLACREAIRARKEEFPALYDIACEIAPHWYGWDGLMGVDRPSTESTDDSLCAHMAAPFLNRRLLASVKPIFLDKKTASEDELAYYRTFVEHYEPSERSKKWPNILIGEGTGLVRAVYGKGKSPTRLKDHIALPEYVKEELVMTRSEIPFYKYLFEILSNVMIDKGLLRVQSFILAYTGPFTERITKGEVSREEFDKQRFLYGVHINDLLDANDSFDGLCLVATPAIEKKVLDENRRLASRQLPYPPTYMKDGKHLEWIKQTSPDLYTPIMSEKLWDSIKRKYAKYIPPESKGLFTHTREEFEQNAIRYHQDTASVTMLLVPPRELDVVVSSLEQQIGLNSLYAIVPRRTQSNLGMVEVWVCLAKTQ
jgi:hypothetical protein